MRRRTLQPDDLVLKVTGRYFVPNLEGVVTKTCFEGRAVMPHLVVQGKRLDLPDSSALSQRTQVLGMSAYLLNEFYLTAARNGAACLECHAKAFVAMQMRADPSRVCVLPPLAISPTRQGSINNVVTLL